MRTPPRVHRNGTQVSHFLVLFIVCSIFLGLFSLWAGGFRSDLGGDPDEAAHAVTSLMVRDFLAGEIGSHPMRFAQAYYDSFPRVALGHYPPLYYIVAAPFLLIQPEIDLLLCLQVVMLAALATLTALIGKHLLPERLAIASGTGVIFLPIALKLTLHVMADILLAVMCLWAAILWASYLRNPSVRRAVGWGLVAAGAILTKGSGVGLCILPPLGTLLSGRWRLMLTWSWWCSALPVVALACPWMIYSAKISKEGMTSLSPWQYLQQAVPFHLEALPAVFGWPLAALAIPMVLGGALECMKKRSLQPESASLAAMTTGMTFVLLLVPVGLTTRYMLTLAPAVLLAAACFLTKIPLYRDRPHRNTALAAILLTSSLVTIGTSGIPQKDVHGFETSVTKAGVPSIDAHAQNWLIASDPRGEGAVIAAAAFACPRRTPSLLRVYRGSKELAQSDWMGRGYRAAHDDAFSLLRHLDQKGITRVFVDLSAPANVRKEHERALEKALGSAPERWKVEFEQPVVRGEHQRGVLRVYHRL